MSHPHRDTLLNAYFGEFGGQYVPDMLYPVLDELEQAYVDAINDPTFAEELVNLYVDYLGRPTPVTECANLPLEGHGKGKARIFLKREDLVHGGAHKGNQVIAMVAALCGMKCTIYLGARDVARQQPNVYRMRLMGAEVVPVEEANGNGLENAIDVALMDWVNSYKDTHYLLGTAAGPHPFPTLVKEFQAVISRESREQMMERTGALPDVVVACVGGGSNAIGAFADYLTDKPGNSEVKLVGVEPAGEGLDSGKHGAPLNRGRAGILHGSRSYVMLGEGDEVLHSHSVSAGLDYPGVGPEHAYLLESGRAQYVGITDAEALQAFRLLSRHEGIIPALESSHALAYALKLADIAEETGEETTILVNLSGRGDKDVNYVRALLGDLAATDPMEHPVQDLHVADVIAELSRTDSDDAVEG